MGGLYGMKTIYIRPYIKEQKPLNSANFAVFGDRGVWPMVGYGMFFRAVKQLFHRKPALRIGTGVGVMGGIFAGAGWWSVAAFCWSSTPTFAVPP
jgi:hypothetical protein